MAFLQERNRLLEDKEFKRKLTFYALGKCKDKEVAIDLVLNTLEEFAIKTEEAIKEIDNLEAFCFGILRNQIKWHYYKDNNKNTPDIVPLPDDDIVVDITFEDPLSKMMIEQIRQAVRRDLPEISEKVFDLHFINGCMIQEVAQILGKKAGHIRKIIYNIRKLANRFRNE